MEKLFFAVGFIAIVAISIVASVTVGSTAASLAIAGLCIGAGSYYAYTKENNEAVGFVGALVSGGCFIAIAAMALAK